MKEPSKQVLRLVKKIKKDTGIECDPYTFRRMLPVCLSVVQIL